MREEALELTAKLQNLPENQNQELARSILADCSGDILKLLCGVGKFFSASKGRPLNTNPVIWQRSGVKLYDYGTAESDTDGQQTVHSPEPRPIATVSRPSQEADNILLVIPSLINRSHILDLGPGKSFMQYMAANGSHPMLIDWGDPGEFENTLDISGYISSFVLPIIDFLKRLYNKPIFIAGYCMGGLLALASSQLAQDKLAGLILLASPWDFHTPDFPRLKVSDSDAESYRSLLRNMTPVPSLLLQSSFYMNDPMLFQRKFEKFAEMEQDSEENATFVGVEQWVNDGVDMSPHVASECMIDWAHYNAPSLGNWKILGEKIDPSQIRIPALSLIGKRDRIVPPSSALKITESLPLSTTITPDTGHIGIMAGSSAATSSWQPLRDWVSHHNLS